MVSIITELGPGVAGQHLPVQIFNCGFGRRHSVSLEQGIEVILEQPAFVDSVTLHMTQIALTHRKAERGRVDAQVGQINQAELAIFQYQYVAQVQRAEVHAFLMQLRHEFAEAFDQRLTHRRGGNALQHLTQGVARQRCVMHGTAAIFETVNVQYLRVGIPIWRSCSLLTANRSE